MTRWSRLQHRAPSRWLCTRSIQTILSCESEAQARCYVAVQTNHLGHFVLASEIAAHRVRQAAPRQRQAAHKPLRVVIVSSVASRAGRLHWTDLQARLAPLPTAISMHQAARPGAPTSAASFIAERLPTPLGAHKHRSKSQSLPAVHSGLTAPQWVSRIAQPLTQRSPCIPASPAPFPLYQLHINCYYRN